MGVNLKTRVNYHGAGGKNFIRNAVLYPDVINEMFSLIGIQEKYLSTEFSLFHKAAVVFAFLQEEPLVNEYEIAILDKKASLTDVLKVAVKLAKKQKSEEKFQKKCEEFYVKSYSTVTHEILVKLNFKDILIQDLVSFYCMEFIKFRNFNIHTPPSIFYFIVEDDLQFLAEKALPEEVSLVLKILYKNDKYRMGQDWRKNIMVPGTILTVDELFRARFPEFAVFESKESVELVNDSVEEIVNLPIRDFLSILKILSLGHGRKREYIGVLALQVWLQKFKVESLLLVMKELDSGDKIVEEFFMNLNMRKVFEFSKVSEEDLVKYPLSWIFQTHVE